MIDLFEKVTDKDAAVYTRKIAREEGIFVGNSAGSAIKGLLQLKDQLTEDDVVVHPTSTTCYTNLRYSSSILHGLGKRLPHPPSPLQPSSSSSKEE